MDELSLSINYTRANTDGSATETEFLVDGATGTTVLHTGIDDL